MMKGVFVVISIAGLAAPACGRTGAPTSAARETLQPPEPHYVGARRSEETPPTASAPSRCGDVTGEWSSEEGGLRARLVTTGSRDDRSALQVKLEIQNTTDNELVLRWNGPPLGLAVFRLEDDQGDEATPDWAVAGNEISSNFSRAIAAHSTLEIVVAHNLFVTMSGSRAVRIGAFWGRAMPTDGSRRYLRAVISPVPPRGAPDRTWTGRLEAPRVCID